MFVQYIILRLPADPQQYRTEYCYISCLATLGEKRDRFPHLSIQFTLGLRNHNAHNATSILSHFSKKAEKVRLKDFTLICTVRGPRR